MSSDQPATPLTEQVLRLAPGHPTPPQGLEGTEMDARYVWMQREEGWGKWTRHGLTWGPGVPGAAAGAQAGLGVQGS